MRLIDADVAERWMMQNEAVMDTAILKAIPTVDAVQVVRCKECKYYKPEEYECGCDFAGGLPYVKSDDFCSYGERRDDNGR